MSGKKVGMGALALPGAGPVAGVPQAVSPDGCVGFNVHGTRIETCKRVDGWETSL